jgi:hypothetical protein
MESYCTEVQYLHFLWGIQPVKTVLRALVQN